MCRNSGGSHRFTYTACFILKFHFKTPPMRNLHEIAESVHLKEGCLLCIMGLFGNIKVGYQSGRFTNEHAAWKEWKGSVLGPLHWLWW